MNTHLQHCRIWGFVYASVALAWSGLTLAQVNTAFDIPAQPLSQALVAFSEQSKLVITAATPLLTGKKAPQVYGMMAPEEALQLLLEGSALKYSKGPGGEMIIVEVSQTTAAPEGVAKGTRIADTDGSSPTKEEGEDQKGSLDVPASSEAGTSKVQEIVVTAQKRVERLQDVPISITVLDGLRLDQSTVQGVAEALSHVAGVATSPSSVGGGTIVTVRGASAGGPIFAGSSPVSYYLDSVPFGLVQSATAPDTSAYDLQRVEVLRGPQGTLYGASAQAGVVRVLTRDPDLGEFGLNGRTGISTTKYGGENYRADAALNAPLIEGKLAARVVLGYQNLSGWIDRLDVPDANDAEIVNARFKILAKPTEKLTLTGSAWISRSDFGGVTAANSNRFRNTFAEYYESDYDVYGLTIDYDFSGFSLKSMTSYLDFTSGGPTDLGGNTPFLTRFDGEVFVQEVNLASTGTGPWRWTAGAIYRDAHDQTFQTIDAFALTLDWTNGSKSYAMFGEITRLLADGRLELTAGARYFNDKVVSRENQTVEPVNPPNYYRAEDSFHALTPRAVITLHPGTASTLYASYSQGFRSGTPQPYYVTNGVPGFPSVKPDKLHNYEIGAKGNLGRAIFFETAVYYLDWKDVQQALTVPFGSTPVAAIVNGQSANGLGFDVGFTLRPLGGLNMTANFSANDLTMDADILSGGALLFAKGDRPNYSPKYTIGGAMDYSFALGTGGLEGQISVSGNYTSRQGQRSIVNNVQVLGYGDSILVARTEFAVKAPDGRWRAAIFADNISNEQDAVVGNPFNGPDWAVRIRPRTIGLQVDFNL